QSTCGAKASSLLSVRRLGDLGPGTVGIATGGPAHGLWATVNPDSMHKIATAVAAAVIVILGNDFAVAPIIRIAPTHRPARRASLPGIHFGLLGQLAIALVERAADFVADDAADHGAGDGAQRLARALAELVADHTTGDGAN